MARQKKTPVNPNAPVVVDTAAYNRGAWSGMRFTERFNEEIKDIDQDDWDEVMQALNRTFTKKSNK